MFTGNLDIDCVLLSRGHTQTELSPSLFLLLRQLSLSASRLICWQIRVNQLQGISNLSLSLPLCARLSRSHYTAVLMSHCFQSVIQPDHINPSLSFLPTPQLSLSFFLPPPSLSISLSLSFSPSQSVWVSEFPPQCRIPHLINRYAGMIRIGQQAVSVIPASYWDYRVQPSVPLVDPFIVQYHCPFFLYCPFHSCRSLQEAQ